MLGYLHIRVSGLKQRVVLPFLLGIVCTLTITTGILAVMQHVSAAGANTLCVKPGGGDGCYSSIGGALLEAHTSDTIKVAAGIYTENVYITQTVALLGGWSLDFSQRNPGLFVTTIRPADPLAAVVTVQGQLGDWSAVTPTVDGFTITGARSNNHGGGVRLRDSNAVISHNVITDNQAYLLGGGMWVQRGAPLIENNQVENNVVGEGGTSYGGGIELEATQATLTGNIIASNVVTDMAGYGGGIAVEGGGPITITGNSLLNNFITNSYTMTLPKAKSARVSLPGKANVTHLLDVAGGMTVGLGGGLSLEGVVTATVSANLVQGNIGVVQGDAGGAGGIYITTSSAIFNDNTIQDNVGTTRASQGAGGGIGVDNGASASFANNIIRDNTAISEPGYSSYGRGGGVIAFGCTMTFNGDLVEDNDAGDCPQCSGGGLSIIDAQMTMNAARITGNSAYAMGAFYFSSAVFGVNDTGAYTITNSVVANNSATINGGVVVNSSNPGSMVNNTFVNNGDIAIQTSSPLTIANSIIMSHTVGISYTRSPHIESPLTDTVPVSVTYSDFWANNTNTYGFTLDPSNLTVNPQLTADYHLGSASPMIDTGTRNGAPQTDIDGEPRPMKGTGGLFRFDIGADERVGEVQINRHLATDPADFTLIGPGNPIDNPNSDGTNDWIGYAVLGGDVNGDNKADLLAGAPNLSDDFDGGVNDSGRMFGLYGDGTRRVGVTDLLTTTPSLEVRSWLHQQHIGQSLAAADLNGDGDKDLIIGSQGGDSNGTPITGTVFVFDGGMGLSGTRTLSPTMQANWRFKSGESTQTFGGQNALTAGQLNSSGPADLVVGEAQATGPNNRTHAGAIYVFFGGSNLPPLWDLHTTPASLSIYGPATDAELGRVATGDINGDGVPDLIARSPSTIYVFYGPLPSGTIDLATTAADATITNAAGGWLAAGDVNGDDKADIVVSTPTEVDVVLGGSLAASQTLQQATWARFTGLTTGSLWTADWNADGKAEVLVGDWFDNRTFVIFGGTSLRGTSDIYERAEWIVYGENTGDQFGHSIGSGDLDGDGVTDIIIGSRSHVVDDHPTYFEDAGAVYVLYGTRGQPGGTPTPTSTSTPGILTPTSTPVSCNFSFTDVPEGSTFYPYVHCLTCLGIISGYADGTFRPNNNVTRGQVAKIVSNAAAFNDPQTMQVFQDVPADSTFFEFIGRLASRGYMSGYQCGGAGEPCGPGNLPYFRPVNNATRGQIAKIDSNAASFSDTPLGQQFEDIAVSSTYYTYTYRLTTRNIMSGYPCGGAGEPCGPGNLPYFRANKNATRGQTSKIVANTFYPDCQTLYGR